MSDNPASKAGNTAAEGAGMAAGAGAGAAVTAASGGAATPVAPAVSFVVNKVVTGFLKLLPYLLLFAFFFVYLFMALIFGGAQAQANAAEETGSCASAAGDYQSGNLTKEGYNPSVVLIAYQTAMTRNASDKVILALFETGLVESNMKSYANDGQRQYGPSHPNDDGISDAELAIAKKSMALPHDAVGTDHTSIGFLQQQNSWGSPSQRLDPAYAAGKFLDKAIPYARTVGGSAGQLAQKVQVSAFPTAYDGREGDAKALLARVKAGVFNTAAKTDEKNPLATGTGRDPETPAGIANPDLAGGATADVNCNGGDATFTPGETKTVTSKGVSYKVTLPADAERAATIANALSRLGTKYVLGYPGAPNYAAFVANDNPAYFDCASFTSWSINRGTNGRLLTGKTNVSTIRPVVKDVTGEAHLPGDLIFFQGDEHVGIYLGTVNGQPRMVHAPYAGDVVKIGTIYEPPTSWGRPAYK